MTETLHSCAGDTPEDAYGPAISSCDEDDEGRLWVSNGEYASQVNYCPYCGYKARVAAIEMTATART